MTENNVVAFHQKDEIDDPLTEILRSGARRLIERAVEAEFAAFLASHDDLTGFFHLYRTDPRLDRANRVMHGPNDALATVRQLRRGIAGRRAPNGFAIRRRSCRNGRDARKASMSFCRRFICAEFRPAIFRTC